MVEEFLTPLDNYLKVGLHIGTKFKTKYMEPFIFKVRNDGLSILNVKKIDARISVAAKFLAQYNPESIVVVCRRETGWKAAKLFSKLTKIPVFAGRYRPGLMTNPRLEGFMEPKILFVADPWPDKNAVLDAIRIGIPIIGLCDTNNEANYLDLVIPCNNKGKKSLGLIFWVLAKEYLKLKGIIKNESEMGVAVDEFLEE